MLVGWGLVGCGGARQEGAGGASAPPVRRPSLSFEAMCERVRVQAADGFEPVPWPRDPEASSGASSSSFVAYELRWNVPLGVWRCDDSVSRPPLVLYARATGGRGGRIPASQPLLAHCEQRTFEGGRCPSPEERRVTGRVDLHSEHGVRSLGVVRVGAVVPPLPSGAGCRGGAEGEFDVAPRIVALVTHCDGRRFAWRGPLRTRPQDVTEVFRLLWQEEPARSDE